MLRTAGVRMPLIIDAARASDLPAIHRLLEAQQLPLDGVDEHLDTMIVARTDKGVVGAAAVELYADAALLRSVVVAHAHQGQGLGHRLTESALQVASRHGADTVFLLTTTADRFFPRFGFGRIPRDDVPASVQASVEFQSACPSSATVMKKTLAATR
ncbi:MAG: arsenic resistance N-acetyltransferase ArsN2 [Vicinamibacterales bacterium]